MINNMKKLINIVSEEEIISVWGYANFGDDKELFDKYKIISKGLLKYASGFSTGHTLECILEELKLLKNQKLTERGKMFLYSSYSESLHDYEKYENNLRHATNDFKMYLNSIINNIDDDILNVLWEKLTNVIIVENKYLIK